MSGGMLLSARQAIAMRQLGNAGALTQFLARLASAGALAEVIIAPIFGMLADKYGRRVIVPIGSLATMLVRGILFANPGKLWPVVLEQLVSIPLVTTFFATYRASLGDSLKGASFAKANAKLGVAAGISVMMGPLLTRLMMSRTSPRYCYLVSSLLAGISFAHLVAHFEESLPRERRKELQLSSMQPLSFLKLMRSRVLSRLMISTGLQTFTEGRNVTDIVSIHLLNHLSWTWSQINSFIGSYGASLIVSGLAVKSLLNRLGLRGFTTFCNSCNCLNWLAFAYAPPFNSFLSPSGAMYLGLAFGIPGGRKRDGVESLIMKVGNELGFGNGFISSSMMNLRALVNVIGPLLFSALYNLGARRKFPVAFLAAAGTVVAAEITLRTLSDKDLGLDRKDGAPQTPRKD